VVDGAVDRDRVEDVVPALAVERVRPESGDKTIGTEVFRAAVAPEELIVAGAAETPSTVRCPRRISLGKKVARGKGKFPPPRRPGCPVENVGYGRCTRSS
jgi:hypothetical protein